MENYLKKILTILHPKVVYLLNLEENEKVINEERNAIKQKLFHKQDK